MLLPAAILVLAAGGLLAWFAWRRLPRPWNRLAALAALMPAAAILLSLAAGLATGWLGCTEQPLWRSPTADGRFVVGATSIACAGGATAYNILVEEVKPDGTAGKVRAIWRSLGGPVPVAVDHVPPATFVVRGHDGSAERLPVAPAEVTLEGAALTPSRMWSFHHGRPI